MPSRKSGSMKYQHKKNTFIRNVQPVGATTPITSWNQKIFKDFDVPDNICNFAFHLLLTGYKISHANSIALALVSFKTYEGIGFI